MNVSPPETVPDPSIAPTLAVHHRPGATDIAIYDEDDGTVASVYLYDGDDTQVALRLARQMAAAPALYEALLWAVEWMEDYDGEVMPGWREWGNKARGVLEAAGRPTATDGVS